MKIEGVYSHVVVLTVLCIIGCKSMKKDVYSLPITIGQEYKITNTNRDSIPSPIKYEKPTTQYFFEITRNKKTAYIFYWDGHPFRDLGPMVRKESWYHKVFGEDTQISQTTIFMGQEQEVIVLHFKPDKNTQLMIYSKDMNKDEFHELLNNMSKK